MINKITYALLYCILLAPLFGYIHKSLLELPLSILHYYAIAVFLFGIAFILFTKKIAYPKYIWLMLIYAVYRLASAYIAEEDFKITTHGYFFIENVSIFLIIVIIYNTQFSDRFINSSVTLIKVIIPLAFVATLIQVYDSSFLNAWRQWGYENILDQTIYLQRRASIFGFVNPNELGLSYVPLCSVLIGFLMFTGKKSYVLFLGFVGVSAVLSNTRYVMLGYIIFLGQIIFVHRDKIIGSIRYIFAAGLMGVVLYFILVYTGYDLLNFFNERLFAEGAITEVSRYKALDNFAYFFPQQPIFGTGVHVTSEIKKASLMIGSSQIHVCYLSHLVSYGIVGSLLLFGFWFLLAKTLYNTAIQSGYWGSFFAFLIFLFSELTLVNYSIFFTGLIFAFVFDKYIRDKQAASLQV